MNDCHLDVSPVNNSANDSYLKKKKQYLGSDTVPLHVFAFYHISLSYGTEDIVRYD